MGYRASVYGRDSFVDRLNSFGYRVVAGCRLFVVLGIVNGYRRGCVGMAMSWAFVWGGG